MGEGGQAGSKVIGEAGQADRISTIVCLGFMREIASVRLHRLKVC